MLVGLESSLVFTLLREAELITSRSWRSSASLMLTHAEAAAWLSLLGSVTAADSCLLSCLYWTGLLVYL